MYCGVRKSKHLCDITVAYFAASVLLMVEETETGLNKETEAEQKTQRNKWKKQKKKVRNTLAYRFSGLSLELSCLATLCTVSGNQKNMLQDT